MASYITIVAAVVGLLMYVLCSNAKASEIGRMLFFAAIIGLFVALAPFSVHLFR